jgi:hypothetical protein
MVICTAPVAYSPIQIFKIGHDYALWIRNFMVMMKTPRTSIFRLGPMAHGHNPAKVSKFKYDGILSIGNFMLMINNHFARFQLPGNLLKTKKMCSLFSWQHAISFLFVIILCHSSYTDHPEQFNKLIITLCVKEEEFSFQHFDWIAVRLACKIFNFDFKFTTILI